MSEVPLLQGILGSVNQVSECVSERERENERERESKREKVVLQSRRTVDRRCLVPGGRVFSDFRLKVLGFGLGTLLGFVFRARFVD